MKRYALIPILAIVGACPNTEQPETDTTAAGTTDAVVAAAPLADHEQPKQLHAGSMSSHEQSA